MPEDEFKKEHLQSILPTVEPLEEKDIEQLKPILETHVRDSETGEIIQREVADIQGYMKGKKDVFGRTRKYFVARDDKDNLLGCIGYTQPEPKMISHFNTSPEESAELVNAFVSASVYRGGGVGKTLFNAACDRVKTDGKKQVILNSGPRYKKSWGFYDRLCDESKGFLIDYYGKGRHAKTWRKAL